VPVTAHKARVVRFGVFEVDLQEGQLRKAGVHLKVQAQPFQVLAMLLERPGETVSREDLRQHLWPADTFVDFDHSLNSSVKKLREALGDESASPRYIETLHRHGYRFIAPVETTSPSDIRPGRLPEPSQSSRPGVIAAAKLHWLRATLGLLAVLAVLVASGFVARRYVRTHIATIKSIAVMPFANASKDPEMDYLGEELSQEITNSLSRLPDLQVIAGSTVARYRSRQDDPQALGRDLHVDAVLTGRVAEHGNELTVEAELVNVATGTQLWGERYRRGANDAPLLQATITNEVASQLRTGLSRTQRESLVKLGTHDPEVYQLYLKGRYRLEKGTRADTNAGIEYFRQAIQRDSNYAAAYAGLARAYINSEDLWMSPREAMPKAREAARKALELDESLSDAHAVMAFWSMWSYDYDGSSAESEFKRALELDSRNGSAHYNYGLLLILRGRIEEGIEEGRRAVELDPFSLALNTDLGALLYYARRYDQAVKQLRKAVDMEPNYWFSRTLLGLAYEQQGDLSAALDELQKASKLGLESETPYPLAELGHAYAQSGRQGEAEQVLRELAKRGAQGYVCPYYLATVYVGLGKKEQALAFLWKAYAYRSGSVAFLKADPELDPLRSDPRFVELVREVGLPQ